MFNWKELVGDGYENLSNGTQKIVVKTDEYIVKAEKTPKEDYWWLSCDYINCHWNPEYHKVSDAILYFYLKRFMAHHDLIDKDAIAPIDWKALVGDDFTDCSNIDNRHEIEFYWGHLHVEAEYGNNCLWYVKAYEEYCEHRERCGICTKCFSKHMTDDELYQYIQSYKGMPIKNILLAHAVDNYMGFNTEEHFSHKTSTHIFTGYKYPDGWTFIAANLLTKEFILLEKLSDEEVLKQIEMLTK